MEHLVGAEKIADGALQVGVTLTLDCFRAWRRDRPCLDALVLMAISRANVDGILYHRDVRTRFGGASRIAPDVLRQPVSVSVLAISLRLRESVVQRAVLALEDSGDCQVTPSGMLITRDQVEVTDRDAVRPAIYAALRRAYGDLTEIGFFGAAPLPRFEATTEPPIRSAAAHCAKYMLRLCGSLAAQECNFMDALLIAELLRQRWSGPAAPPTHRAGRADETAAAATLGLPRQEAARRLGRLRDRGLLKRLDEAAAAPGPAGPWLAGVAARNIDHLFQLYAGLAEAGALADWHGEAEARGRGASRAGP